MCSNALHSFLLLTIFLICYFFLISTINILLILFIFYKNQFLVLQIFSLFLLFSISLISSFIFTTPFFLLFLGLICTSFHSFLRWKLLSLRCFAISILKLDTFLWALIQLHPTYVVFSLLFGSKHFFMWFLLCPNYLEICCLILKYLGVCVCWTQSLVHTRQALYYWATSIPSYLIVTDF